MSNIEAFTAFTKADIEAARAMICKEAPDEIIRLILHRCSQLGCDPLARMIYAVLRKGKWQLQSSIDLFRSIASADADYGGQDGPFWCGSDGIWKDVWLSKEKPAAAKVGVYRKGFSAPTYAVANWDAYAVTGDQGFMWQKMPALMLAKTAEALALRKAFPQKLAGLYTNDEMAQADNTKHVTASPLPAVLPPAERRISPQEADAILTHGNETDAGVILADVRALGKAMGNLQGAVNQDLQRLGGDVLALKAEYENALANKNPRGTPDHAVAVSAPEPEEPTRPAVDGEAGTYTQETVDIISAGIGADILQEAPPSPNTQAILSLMQAFLHPDVQSALPSHSDQLRYASSIVGLPVSAWSQLTPAGAERIAVSTRALYRPDSDLASDADVCSLQISLKDADFVAYLKTSKAYKAAQEAKDSQAESLRVARLAYAKHVLGREVASFKEITTSEAQTLFSAFKAFKEKT